MYTKKLNYKKLLEDFLNYKRSCGYKYNSEEITLKYRDVNIKELNILSFK